MAFILEKQGNTLVKNVDGHREVFYNSGHGYWISAINGALTIAEQGNELIIRTQESRLIAYQIGGPDVWICTGSFVAPPAPIPPDPPKPPTETHHFSWPYDPTWLHYTTSWYGPRNGRFHEGQDFAGGPASYGLPIPASNAGIVHQSGLNGAFGYSVILRHPNYLPGYVLYTLYAHMPNHNGQPAVGANVVKGQHIGFINATGSAQGSHLHFETHQHPNGGHLRWDNFNPSYSSPRTAVDPRHFMTSYGDGRHLLS